MHFEISGSAPSTISFKSPIRMFPLGFMVYFGISLPTVVWSLSSIPEMEFITITTSETVLPIGPTCSRLFAYEIRPNRLTHPYVGFRPTTEQKLAGHLTDPPVSEPREIAHSDAATLAPLPPDEPPGTNVVFHGLWVDPCILNSVVDPIANSSRFNFPTTIAQIGRAHV